MKTTGKIKAMPSTYRYRWVIPKFCACNTSTSKPLFSPTFSSHGCNWLMELCKRIDPDSKIEYVAIFLTLCEPKKIKINYTFNILTQDDQIHDTAKRSETCVFTEQDSSWGHECFLESSLLNHHINPILVNGQLTIECTISTQNEIENEQNTTAATSLTESFNFEKFLFSESLSDVQLIVGKEVLYAHKFILAARSDVFTAMFTHEMKESTENKVTIEDFNLEVVKEMLRYIYTQKVDKIETITEDLLAVADKYLLYELMSICETHLIESLSNDNFLNRMVTADKYNLHKLKKETIQFITFNSDNIIQEIMDIQ